MYAVIETGGKQYFVKKDAIITVELLSKDSEVSTISFKNVLLVNDGEKIIIENTLLKNAEVKATILSIVKNKKKIAFKYRKRKNSKKKIGHRQKLNKVKIEEIIIG